MEASRKVHFSLKITIGSQKENHYEKIFEEKVLETGGNEKIMVKQDFLRSEYTFFMENPF